MQRFRALTAAIAAATALFALFALAPSAHAQQSQTFQAQLDPLNDSGSSGTATVEVNGSSVTVTVESQGVSPALPHAQHIHIGGENVCPPPSAATESEPNDLISTAEGAPFYGGVQVSLTTEGDVGAGSALAVERFPVASDTGTISYQRTFELPEGVTVDDISKGVIVQHGISSLFADESMYDGEPRSSLDESLPLEATIPTNCGPLMAVGQTGGAPADAAQQGGQVAATPAGGVAAGAGGTATDEPVNPLIPAAAIALIGAVAAGAVAARRSAALR